MPTASSKSDPATFVPPTGSFSDAEQLAWLVEAGGSQPIHERDQVPGFLLRIQGWFQGLLSNRSRLVLGLVVVGTVVLLLLALSSLRLLRIVLDDLDLIAFVGLFLVNWLGNGGALVPIPGARLLGLLMVFHEAVLLPSWEVFVVSGAAMALGLLSYYMAGARSAKSYAEGDAAGALQIASDTGMLDGDTTRSAPSGEPGQQAAPDAVAAPVAAEPSSAVVAANETAQGHDTRFSRLKDRLSTSLQAAQARAQPVIERRGPVGMFLLCLAPTPMGTAAAFLGGLMRFGFVRYLLASFAAKYLLAGAIIAFAFIFSDAARALPLPDLGL